MRQYKHDKTKIKNKKNNNNKKEAVHVRTFT